MQISAIRAIFKSGGTIAAVFYSGGLMPIKKRKIARLKPKEKLGTQLTLALAETVHNHASSQMALALASRIHLLNSGLLTVEKIESAFILHDLFVSLSYAYYVKDNPLVSDGVFDAICKAAYKRALKGDCELLVLQKDALKAGTGHHLDWNNFVSPPPEIVYNAVISTKPTRSAANDHANEETNPQEATHPQGIFRKPHRVRRPRRIARTSKRKA